MVMSVLSSSSNFSILDNYLLGKRSKFSRLQIVSYLMTYFDKVRLRCTNTYACIYFLSCSL